MVRAVTVTVTVTSATASSEPANQNPGAAWHHEDSSGVPGDEGHSGRDPQDKKVIICDEKLKKIFEGKDRDGFLEIAKLIGPHFL
uniref:DM2 domain-containing protein n=1 Tax=Brassica campestris TaxID=3711 RepID=M4F0M2_BRACM